MRTLWMPGVNGFGAYGRWDFVEFRDVFAIRGIRRAGRAVHAKGGCVMAGPPRPKGRSLRHATSGSTCRPRKCRASSSARKNSPRPPKHYARRAPLAEGEPRERNPDRDPQLLWNGMRITLTEAQRAQLAETGEVEIGEAQLVWRGKDAGLVRPRRPYAAALIQEKIHPRRSSRSAARSAASDEAASGPARPVRRFQRPAAGRAGRVLPA